MRIGILFRLAEPLLLLFHAYKPTLKIPPVVCTTRQAAIYGRVCGRYGAHAHERYYGISSYIRSDIRIERTGVLLKEILKKGFNCAVG